MGPFILVLREGSREVKGLVLSMFPRDPREELKSSSLQPVHLLLRPADFNLNISAFNAFQSIFHKHHFVLHAETCCQILSVSLQKHFKANFRDEGIFWKSHGAGAGTQGPQRPPTRASELQSSPFKEGGLALSSSPRPPTPPRGNPPLPCQSTGAFLSTSIHIWLLRNPAPSPRIRALQ